jgi:hypothetical protein
VGCHRHILISGQVKEKIARDMADVTVIRPPVKCSWKKREKGKKKVQTAYQILQSVSSIRDNYSDQLTLMRGTNFIIEFLSKHLRSSPLTLLACYFSGAGGRAFGLTLPAHRAWLITFS